MQGYKLEDTVKSKEQSSTTTTALQHAPPLQHSVQTTSINAGEAVFCDAAWNPDPSPQQARAGIVIFIQMGNDNQHCRNLHVAALSPPASSPLQAEAFGLLFATKLAKFLQLQEPQFYTDCLVLASAAATEDIIKTSGIGLLGHF
jgi:hypothetical protein